MLLLNIFARHITFDILQYVARQIWGILKAQIITNKTHILDVHCLKLNMNWNENSILVIALDLLVSSQIVC